MVVVSYLPKMKCYNFGWLKEYIPSIVEICFYSIVPNFIVLPFLSRDELLETYSSIAKRGTFKCFFSEFILAFTRSA